MTKNLPEKICVRCKKPLAGGRNGNLIGVMLNTAQSVVGIISNFYAEYRALKSLSYFSSTLYLFIFIDGVIISFSIVNSSSTMM